MDAEYDVVIVGAGVAGLTAAVVPQSVLKSVVHLVVEPELPLVPESVLKLPTSLNSARRNLINSV